MMKKLILIELTWLLALLITSLCIDFLIFGGFSFFKDYRDIQMHDTYFTISGIKWFLAIFVFISTLVYIIKEAKSRFSHSLSNIILTTLLISMLFFIIEGHRLIYAIQHMQGGWKVYPPLSALPEVMEILPAPPTPLWSIFFLIIEVMIVIGLFVLGFKTGKLTNSIKR
ncbi:hypothetical protein [Catalinimonas niigatensis]|uniref:hypothetical protein n=1 Tax=Catalinimonas niigatensis TaxID=1397264 RepID=UPI0026659D99|nr:hypothetical protein [Catalinimonas niigatensis]WPP52992.1 hypothetical protein PZB72_11460 [Catalinimonas niigatensis]